MTQELLSAPRRTTFLDIQNAAARAGFSERHFRKMIESDKIPIIQIGKKFFILGADFEKWEATKKSKK